MSTSHSDAIEAVLSTGGSASSLFLEGAIRKVDIGVYQHEHGSPQRVMFDIHVIVNDSRPSNDSIDQVLDYEYLCLLYTSPSPRDATLSRMPSSA